MTGIPLPMISSGGTSLLITMVVFGLLANFARRETQAAAALQAGGGSRMARFLGIGSADPTGRRRPPPAARECRRPSGREAPAGQGRGPDRSNPARRQTARHRQQRPAHRRRHPMPAAVQRVRRTAARPNPADRCRPARTDNHARIQAGTDQAARPVAPTDGSGGRQQPSPRPGTRAGPTRSRQRRPRRDGA